MNHEQKEWLELENEVVWLPSLKLTAILRGPPESPCYMIKSTLKIARYCPLVIQGFSNFLGLFQMIMANPVLTLRIGQNDPKSEAETTAFQSHQRSGANS